MYNSFTHLQFCYAVQINFRLLNVSVIPTEEVVLGMQIFNLWLVASLRQPNFNYALINQTYPSYYAMFFFWVVISIKYHVCHVDSLL